MATNEKQRYESMPFEEIPVWNSFKWRSKLYKKGLFILKNWGRIVNDIDHHSDPWIPRLQQSKPEKTRITNGQDFELHDLGRCETQEIARVQQLQTTKRLARWSVSASSTASLFQGKRERERECLSGGSVKSENGWFAKYAVGVPYATQCSHAAPCSATQLSCVTMITQRAPPLFL